ncbi:hypothetical protein O181_035364 [Austropuccinia psidii MF-1]|uniref:Secreted protein n=1 Tax=Austropuccinia psidii MF-1 TaxID=1389203 RepID=A0A9Q3D2H6_9BASI|nr:hypothetical protein [Austropuccinia psidii MF-1]
MAHIRWHSIVFLSLFLALIQDPNTSHTKPCAVNPYAGAASRQCQQFLMLVQDPNASHANPYAFTSSQKFKQLPMPGKPPDNSDTSLCQCSLSTRHTQILTLCRFRKIQTIPYSSAGFQQFSRKS